MINDESSEKFPVYCEELSVNKEGIKMVLSKGQKIIENIANNLLEFLKASEAPNFAEMKLFNKEGFGVLVTVQRLEGESPTDQIKKLKERILELEQQLDEKQQQT